VLLETNRDVAHLVNCAWLYATEVFDAREDDVDELVEEVLHSLAAERDGVARDIAHTDLEIRNGFLGTARSGSLARDPCQAVNDEFELLLVFLRADARGNHDFHKTRRLHDIFVAKLSLKSVERLGMYCLCCHIT